MHEYISQGDIAAMERAFGENPQSVNDKNEAGFPPLYTAALYRNQAALDFLLDHGAELDIFACAYLGKPREAESLLRQAPQLATASLPNGMTPLHMAARTGQAAVAQLLIQHKADVNAQGHQGRTPLHEACHGGPWKPGPAEDIIQLLLDHGAQTDLITAAGMGRTLLMQSLLDEDPSRINERNEDGETALFAAAQNNQFEAVKLLVERGADMNNSDAVGTAALHRCSQQCSDELIRYLIDHGANARLCCHVACGDEAGTREVMQRDPEAAQEVFYEFTAVEYAIHCWQLGTLRILLKHGCPLSEEDQGHIRRISGNDEELLNELLSLSNHG